MSNYRPAIDQICDTLNCTPGQAPERVRKLVKSASQRNGMPGDQPPNDERSVLLLLEGGMNDIGYFDGSGWQYTENEDVIAWCEIPPRLKMEHLNG